MKCVYTYIGYRQQSTHSNPGLESSFLQDITVSKEMKFATSILYYIGGEMGPESFLEIGVYLNLSTLAVLNLAHWVSEAFKAKTGCYWLHTLRFLPGLPHTSIWTELDDLCFSFLHSSLSSGHSYFFFYQNLDLLIDLIWKTVGLLSATLSMLVL